MKKTLKIICLAGFLLTGFQMLFAQGITTASAYFKTISENYGTFKDYECDFELNVDKKEYAGKISYKAPNLLRMDYTNPAEQVICFNGDLLTIYLPNESAVLQQSVSSEAGANSLATPQGLTLLSRYYTVAYETGQDPVPLEDDSDEMVVNFLLNRKSSSESFRYIRISVNAKTNLIRRIEAVTPKGETFIFNFYDYKLNQGIADVRFIYDPPSSANDFNNFLFSE